MSHRNIVQNFAICMDAGHIAIIQEYMPKGNLKQLLANNNIVLSWSEKFKIAKQVNILTGEKKINN